ncbi:MAG: PEGA domain-containing protein [Deltaproteobacteria bacterium]|nr:PEGA domain-containing protein [Deltaproteobacteria bacterium]
MRACTSFLRWTLILVVALIASSAHAGKKHEAARAFKQGKRLFKKRSYVQAITAFTKAYKLRPHFFVQCSIARCYENMNDFIQSAAHYRRCLNEGAAKAKMAERVRESLEGVERRVATLEIKSHGGGGTIFVDGKKAGMAPGTISINPGRHAIEVRREGATPARASVESSLGGSMSITLSPKKIVQAVRTKVVMMPQPASRPQTFEPRRRGLHQAWFWGAVGATVVFGAVVGIFGAQTVGLRDDYESDPTEQGYDDFTQRRMLTNVFVALTGVAAAATTTLFFFTDFGQAKEHEDDDAHVWGIGLRGNF